MSADRLTTPGQPRTRNRVSRGRAAVIGVAGLAASLNAACSPNQADEGLPKTTEVETTTSIASASSQVAPETAIPTTESKQPQATEQFVPYQRETAPKPISATSVSVGDKVKFFRYNIVVDPNVVQVFSDADGTPVDVGDKKFQVLSPHVENGLFKFIDSEGHDYFVTPSENLTYDGVRPVPASDLDDIGDGQVTNVMSDGVYTAEVFEDGQTPVHAVIQPGAIAQEFDS